MQDVTLISCSYNTPQVTITMLKSFLAYHKPIDIFILDNSTNDETSKLLEENNVPYEKNPKGLHTTSVDKLFKKVKTKYALLVDTDVVFLKPLDPIFKKFKENNLTLLGRVCGDRGNKSIHFRVHPWFCFINLDNIRKNNINFYNPDKHSLLEQTKLVDVGCTFYDDIKSNNLLIGDINIENNYFKHYEGMSWRTKRFSTGPEGDIDVDENATHNNHRMYNYGLKVEAEYKEEIERFKNIEIAL